MEMKVKEDKFWYLDSGKGKFLFDDESEAIKKLKESAKGNKKAKELNLQVMEIKDDKMELKPILWQDIAMELMK